MRRSAMQACFDHARFDEVRHRKFQHVPRSFVAEFCLRCGFTDLHLLQIENMLGPEQPSGPLLLLRELQADEVPDIAKSAVANFSR